MTVNVVMLLYFFCIQAAGLIKTHFLNMPIEMCADYIMGGWFDGWGNNRSTLLKLALNKSSLFAFASRKLREMLGDIIIISDIIQ